MNSKERLQKAIAGQPTGVPAVAPAYLSLYLDAHAQRFYREAYERKLAGRAFAAGGYPVSIDHTEDARFRAEAILRAYEVFEERPDWIHTHPVETRAWAERGEMRFIEGGWQYADRETGETLDMGVAGRLMLPTATHHIHRIRSYS